jgi:hypothetical protein
MFGFFGAMWRWFSASISIFSGKAQQHTSQEQTPMKDLISSVENRTYPQLPGGGTLTPTQDDAEKLIRKILKSRRKWNIVYTNRSIISYLRLDSRVTFLRRQVVISDLTYMQPDHLAKIQTKTSCYYLLIYLQSRYLDSSIKKLGPGVRAKIEPLPAERVKFIGDHSSDPLEGLQ